jgi:NitT/TauT family transport system permease protein
VKKLWRSVLPFLVVGGAWELTAHFGSFPKRLFPAMETIFMAFVDLAQSGVVFHHVEQTLMRLLLGSLLAALVGVGMGLWMGSSRRVEDYLSPLVSIVAPIPGLAYAPLFMLWFGLGNLSTIILVGFVAFFPIVLNTWTGVKGVKKLWIRAARSLGASDAVMFRQVIFPASLPYILTGLRLGVAQGWRILVAAEMLAAVPWGLGWLIFGAREFMNTDIMLAGITVIGLTGLVIENLLFKQVEKYTLVRWGMMSA